MIILENRIKFTKSYQLYERSCKSYWHGTTQSKTPENYIPGQFPLFIEKSKGAYLWDIDGNRYTDYIMGYGAISLGYCIDEVDEAAHCPDPKRLYDLADKPLSRRSWQSFWRT